MATLPPPSTTTPFTPNQPSLVASPIHTPHSEKTLASPGTQTPTSFPPKKPTPTDPEEPALNSTLAPWRKWTILFVTSWCAFGATFSSTSLFTAANEISASLSTPTSSIYAATGASLATMGVSSFLWGPIGSIFGRRWSYNCCIGILMLTIIGTALAPNWQVFLAMRILAGFEGTYFHVTGQNILAENFAPLQRGMATGFFLAGTAVGPALGPCVAGVIVTYAEWRVILWLQAGMIGLGLVLSLIFIPESKFEKRILGTGKSLGSMVKAFDPLPTLRLMVYPNVLLTNLSCGFLSWSQYFLLAAPRMVISKRFNLSTPLLIGLFYLAVMGGFLLGTMVGGRWSDHTVRKWMEKRGGMRLPQDRLNAGIFCFFIVIPAFQLTYGWTLVACNSCSTERAGLALPAVTGFFVGAGLLAAFASLNTYCAEVLPKERRRVVMSKYLVQYAFAAAASGGAQPLIQAIGYGPATTLGVIMVLIAGALTMITARYGLRMQRWYESRFLDRSDAGDETDSPKGVAPPV